MLKFNFKEIGLMGDTHGDNDAVLLSLERFKRAGIDVVLHLGDFGVWPNHESYLYNVNSTLKLNNMLMIVTLGNHEDYARLSTLVDSKLYPGFQILDDYEYLLFAKRGQRWEWEGVNFISVGGANSIDRAWRKPNESWWSEEQISMGDVYNSIEGGPADIMISHDTPEGVPIVQALTEKYGESNWPTQALEYAQGSRTQLKVIADYVQPELILHGHYHILADLSAALRNTHDENSPKDYFVRSICFDKEWTPGNLGVLEPPTKRVRYLSTLGVE